MSDGPPPPSDAGTRHPPAPATPRPQKRMPHSLIRCPLRLSLAGPAQRRQSTEKPGGSLPTARSAGAPAEAQTAGGGLGQHRRWDARMTVAHWYAQHVHARPRCSARACALLERPGGLPSEQLPMASEAQTGRRRARGKHPALWHAGGRPVGGRPHCHTVPQALSGCARRRSELQPQGSGQGGGVQQCGPGPQVEWRWIPACTERQPRVHARRLAPPLCPLLAC